MMNADDFSDVYCNPSKQDTPVKELSCMSNPPQ